ncbi:MAG TPA: FKBP-type peptidyl-prolyl cis-trans isomerase [Chitinophagaceae bacterium]|nr:FKBP-type peptidyl-prolyl cis-trans isomerase [Chitinophagaceae bacterium]
MKYYLLPVLSFLLIISAKATDKDSTVNYNLPDSVKAVQFMAEINVQSVTGNKEVAAGIRTDAVKLSLETDKKGREIAFEFPVSASIMANGLNTRIEKDEISLDYNWSFNETYKLLIAVATDSANNFSVYSGYIWLAKENKWKLIGTCKITGRWNTIQQPASFSSSGKKGMQVTIGQVWVQRNNGSWKNMKADGQPNPVVNLFGHIDSTEQHQIDKKKIEDAIASGKTDAKNNMEGIYYTIMKEGNGKQVDLNDTVTVNYRLSLFNDTTVIQETKDKPATFPLKRLIRGWQIGVPLCKVGGKIKLVIPSDLAYSIRTRAADIPPNSILVFEIEVLDAKPPQ